MIEYTILTRQEVEEILESFPLGKLKSFKVLSGGSENTNYKIETERGKYVLTICEQKSMESTQLLINMLQYLEDNHFETSRIICNRRNESVSRWRGKPVMIKNYLEGKVLQHFTPHLLELIGREIGKLHKIDAPEYLPNQISYGKEQFSKVELYSADSDFHLWLKKVLEYISPYLAKNLPKALIHSDVFDSNVVVSEDESKVVIFDFEEATYYYRIFDIGMAIIGTCSKDGKVDLEQAGHLLKGYLKEVRLLDIELDALHAFTVYAGAAMTFWRHINFNYTKPDPDLFDHYLGLKVLADDVWQQPEDCIVKSVK